MVKLGDSCGFGDTVTRGDGFLDSGVYIDKTIADSVHQIGGPLFWAMGVFEDGRARPMGKRPSQRQGSPLTEASHAKSLSSFMR